MFVGGFGAAEFVAEKGGQPRGSQTLVAPLYCLSRTTVVCILYKRVQYGLVMLVPPTPRLTEDLAHVDRG